MGFFSKFRVEFRLVIQGWILLQPAVVVVNWPESVVQKALLQPEAVQWRREKALHSDGFCHFLSGTVSNLMEVFEPVIKVPL